MTNYSAFELSALLFSPFIGKYLDAIGRKNAIIIGDLVLIIATVGLGATQFLESDRHYFIFALIARFLQGVGNALV